MNINTPKIWERVHIRQMYDKRRKWLLRGKIKSRSGRRITIRLKLVG